MKNREGRFYIVVEGDMDFAKGEILELIREDGDHYPRFRSLETRKEAFMCDKYVKKIPKMEIGNQYVVKRKHYGIPHGFKKGEVVTLVGVDSCDVGLFENARGVRQKIKVAGVKKFKCKEPEKKPEPLFEIGDIVRIKEVDGGSINRVGDIGVITEIEKGSARVHIPGSHNYCNWSQLEHLEDLRLKGVIK